MAKANRDGIRLMAFNQPSRDMKAKKLSDERAAKGFRPLGQRKDLRSKIAKERDGKVVVHNDK